VNVCKEVLAMAAPLFPSQLMLVILKITLWPLISIGLSPGCTTVVILFILESTYLLNGYLISIFIIII
jgi:hypothetical protein